MNLTSLQFGKQVLNQAKLRLPSLLRVSLHTVGDDLNRPALYPQTTQAPLIKRVKPAYGWWGLSLKLQRDPVSSYREVPPSPSDKENLVISWAAPRTLEGSLMPVENLNQKAKRVEILSLLLCVPLPLPCRASLSLSLPCLYVPSFRAPVLGIRQRTRHTKRLPSRSSRSRKKAGITQENILTYGDDSCVWCWVEEEKENRTGGYKGPRV